ncbi:hypothetical protein D3C80_1810990 [compost metagenome]
MNFKHGISGLAKNGLRSFDDSDLVGSRIGPPAFNPLIELAIAYEFVSILAWGPILRCCIRDIDRHVGKQ